jgi:hypothetical protein
MWDRDAGRQDIGNVVFFLFFFYSRESHIKVLSKSPTDREESGGEKELIKVGGGGISIIITTPIQPTHRLQTGYKFFVTRYFTRK